MKALCAYLQEINLLIWLEFLGKFAVVAGFGSREKLLFWKSFCIENVRVLVLN